MKKLMYGLITACLLGMGFSAVAQTPVSLRDKKILIVYYSRSGNTAQIARYIQQAVGGDLFQIEPVTAYPSDYHATTEQVKKEIKDGYLPPLKQTVSNIDTYDVVFVGSPCWWSTIAPPVSTFLSTHDLSGKVVIPFSTHGGSGLANNAVDTAKLTPHSTVLEGKGFYGSRVQSAQKEVNAWLTQIGF